jgi:hypothetical protein
MQYNPKAGLIPDGEYDATIVSAEDKTSKSSGNPMIEVVVRVYVSGGQTAEITDWLMEAMIWKMQHLSKAIGHDFEAGNLDPSDVVDQNVRVKVTTQKDEKYGEQNRIGDYLGAASGTVRATVEADPDIPF